MIVTSFARTPLLIGKQGCTNTTEETLTSRPNSQDSSDEFSPAPRPSDATDTTDSITQPLPLAQGYEYVTSDSGSLQTVVDAEDESLTSGLMRHAEIVEKPTREERRADRAEARAAALAAKEAEGERAAQLRAAAAAAAVREAAERDRLVPALAMESAYSEPVRAKNSSKAVFFGSAALLAGAIAGAALLFLPEMNSAADELGPPSSPSAPATVTSADIESARPSAPAPSFNTEAPTVTEQEAAVELPVAPGTISYAPVEAPPAPATEAIVEEIPSEDPTPSEEATESPEPTETAVETPSPEPTESPAPVEPTVSPAPTLPTETSTPEVAPPAATAAPTSETPVQSQVTPTP